MFLRSRRELAGPRNVSFPRTGRRLLRTARLAEGACTPGEGAGLLVAACAARDPDLPARPEPARSLQRASIALPRRRKSRQAAQSAGRHTPGGNATGAGTPAGQARAFRRFS